MKLAVIIPGDYGEELCEQRKVYYNNFASPGTEISVVTTGGTDSLRSTIDYALVLPGAVKQSVAAEKEGFDGIIVQGMWDFGIEAARVAVKIPVVGLGSSTYHLACQLADTFGVISGNDKTIPDLKRRLKLMGCYDRLTSMKAVNIPILEMAARKDELERKFVEIARYQIDKEGAQLIIAGTGAIFPSLGIGSRERIEQALGVPVLEGTGIAIKTLEMLVSLKLTHSKKTYPSPAEAI